MHKVTGRAKEGLDKVGRVALRTLRVSRRVPLRLRGDLKVNNRFAMPTVSAALRELRRRGLQDPTRPALMSASRSSSVRRVNSHSALTMEKVLKLAFFD